MSNAVILLWTEVPRTAHLCELEHLLGELYRGSSESTSEVFKRKNIKLSRKPNKALMRHAEPKADLPPGGKGVINCYHNSIGLVSFSTPSHVTCIVQPMATHYIPLQMSLDIFLSPFSDAE